MTQYLSKSINYQEYMTLLEGLMAQGKTTGSNQSESYLNYAKLNLARMHRLNKTATLNDNLKTQLEKVKEPVIFLVLTEGWCGDAAQNLPTLHLIETACKNIELKLLLRDENLDLMDKYLTNGGRSIPKLICLAKKDLKALFTWGPRPEKVQKITLELKEKNASLADKAEIIHKWYNEDKTQSLQEELKALIEKHLC